MFGGGRNQQSDALTLDRGVADRFDIVVPILRSGSLARQFCERVTRASVDAVFERCLYLRSGDDFLCISNPDIGNGPITLIGGLWALPPLRSLIGRDASICNVHITIGNWVRFALHCGEPWTPLDWPNRPSTDRLIDICAALALHVATGAPQEGLARCVIASEMPEGSPPLVRVARPRITKFEHWMSGARDSRRALGTTIQKAVADLIGLGPGLTPSGDDFLVGALAALDAIGEGEVHARLGCAIVNALRDRTSPLSACFLKAAAAGHVNENLRQAISSLMTGDVEAAVAVAGTIGHSSGWDMTAGILSTLRIFSRQPLSGSSPPAP